MSDQNGYRRLGELYAAADFPELEREAVRLLDAGPVSGSLWQVLGVAQGAQGKTCVDALQRAAALLPTDSGVLQSLAGELMRLGRAAEAAACYARIVRLLPEDAMAHYNLGVACQRLQRLPEAEANYRQALRLLPDFALGHYNLGTVLEDLGRKDDAENCYREALRLQPVFPEVCYNLGRLAQARGASGEAVSFYERVLVERADDADVRNNLAIALKDEGRLADAEAQCRESIRLRPTFPLAFNTLGTILAAARRSDEAELGYRRALALDPGLAEAVNNLGALYFKQGRVDDAQIEYLHALRLRPDYVEARTNLSQSYIDQGRLVEAEDCLQQILAMRPGDAQTLSSLLFLHHYSGHRRPEERFDEALAYGRLVAARVGDRRFSTWTAPRPAGRLRVGFVSGDLRDHPVGYFLESVLSQLDRNEVELFAYPTSRDESELSQRIKPLFSIWRCLAGLDDAAAAAAIHGDGVHVLIDLSGHSADNRLPVFAWKPAPLQVSWLGYFSTTGLAEMDYVLADRTSVPESEKNGFTEKVAYLPDSRLCFSPPDPADAVMPLPALANGQLTFGCFQHLSKLTDETLRLWSEVMSRLPASRLLIWSPQLGEGKPLATQRLLERLRQAGIDDGRVTLQGFVPRDQYLKAYGRVDLLLDTFPYPGGTTTCEALWMGVPTVTLAGTGMLERQGASLLAAAGLPDWVAADADDYVRKAIGFAGDVAGLAKLRAGLRQRVASSPLFDAARFARGFEQVLRRLWNDYAEGAG